MPVLSVLQSLLTWKTTTHCIATRFDASKTRTKLEYLPEPRSRLVCIYRMPVLRSGKWIHESTKNRLMQSAFGKSRQHSHAEDVVPPTARARFLRAHLQLGSWEVSFVSDNILPATYSVENRRQMNKSFFQLLMIAWQINQRPKEAFYAHA